MRWTEEDFQDFLKKQGKQTAKDKPKEKKNKYNAHKVWIDGVVFDSALEGRYYSSLKLLQRAAVIKGFGRQCRFVITEGDSENRGTEYVADFIVFYSDGHTEIVDTKSPATREDLAFKLKMKSFREKYPNLEVKIVEEA